MDLSIFKTLNEMGAETTIHYSRTTNKFYVYTRANISEPSILKSVGSEHCDTIEEAISAFNKRAKGKKLVWDKYIDGKTIRESIIIL